MRVLIILHSRPFRAFSSLRVERISCRLLSARSLLVATRQEYIFSIQFYELYRFCCFRMPLKINTFVRQLDYNIMLRYPFYDRVAGEEGWPVTFKTSWISWSKNPAHVIHRANKLDYDETHTRQDTQLTCQEGGHSLSYKIEEQTTMSSQRKKFCLLHLAL